MRVEKELEKLTSAAKMLVILAEELEELHRKHPLEVKAQGKRVRALGEVLGRAVSELYALSVEVKRPHEDNSAQALRELFF